MKCRHPSPDQTIDESDNLTNGDASAVSSFGASGYRIAKHDAVGRREKRPTRVMVCGVDKLSDQTKLALIEMARCATAQLSDAK